MVIPDCHWFKPLMGILGLKKGLKKNEEENG